MSLRTAGMGYLLGALAMGLAGCSDDDGDDGTSATVDSGVDGGCRVEHTCDAGTTLDAGDGGAGEPGRDSGGGGDGTNGRVVGAGLQIEVLGVTIPADLYPVIELTMTDDDGRALDRTGAATSGSVSLSFTFSYLASTAGVVGQQVPYFTKTVTGVAVSGLADTPALASATQPASDSDGTWTVLDAAEGRYQYRYSVAVPADYDVTKTHTVAGYGERQFEGVQYVSNPVFHFRPDGQATLEHREIVTTAACNHCHNTLQVHGKRREIGVCITCHVDGMADPESGNTLDMRVMVHKIHSGRNLPSVVGGKPYLIVGHGSSVHDFSTVGFPQDVNNCASCHQGGADSDKWKTSFSAKVCSSCHDDIYFDEGTVPPGLTLHPGGARSDSECATCHAEDSPDIGNIELSVTKVHRPLDQLRSHWNLDATMPLPDGPPYKNPPALSGGIVSITDTSNPTDLPRIRFQVAVDGTPEDILDGVQPLNRLRFTFAGPTTDYAGYYTTLAADSPIDSNVVHSATLAPGFTAGEFIWTSTKTMSEIAAGASDSPLPLSSSWSVAMEARISGEAVLSDATEVEHSYQMDNDVASFAITGTTEPRRTSVAIEQCNACHEDLDFHGGSRNDTLYCVMCHTANKDSSGVALPPAGQTALTDSVRFSHMVHRIHTGAEGANDYLDGSFAGLRFPGDRRDCAVCHVDGGFDLPLPGDLLPSLQVELSSGGAVVAGTETYTGATAAACTGCHDDDATAVHVQTQSLVSSTDPQDIMEACNVCHGAGSEFGIDVKHARPGLEAGDPLAE
jgi:OmcA/MtrC family decaheme c-type cytochrome